jgi:hypothetical protein
MEFASVRFMGLFNRVWGDYDLNDGPGRSCLPVFPRFPAEDRQFLQAGAAQGGQFNQRMPVGGDGLRLVRAVHQQIPLT